MQRVKVVQSSADTMYLITADELVALRAKTQRAMQNELLGTRWGTNDIIKRLNGIRRDVLIQHVLIPKRAELEAIHAILSWPSGGRGSGRYLFKATVMARWLEDNLQQITDGGW
ncbi:DUF771 domain-containing protein [Lacticaseibacillus jixiensis]|uniref:DUF771 domain-containing protein n=1 Tax=Lacticaseibacillus jixiensis TaxID=3231926 RepID=UPI0036F2BFB5